MELKSKLPCHEVGTRQGVHQGCHVVRKESKTYDRFEGSCKRMAARSSMGRSPTHFNKCDGNVKCQTHSGLKGEEMRRSNQLIFDVSAGFGWRFEVKCWSAKRSFNLTPACHNQNICQKCHRTSGAETEKLYKIKCFNDSSCHSSEILFGMVSEGASG